MKHPHSQLVTINNHTVGYVSSTSDNCQFLADIMTACIERQQREQLIRNSIRNDPEFFEDCTTLNTILSD